MWAVYTIPKAFMVYSITSIITLFMSGFLVDKFTGRKLILYMNLAITISYVTLYFQLIIKCQLIFFRTDWCL
jgi:MFS family permease